MNKKSIKNLQMRIGNYVDIPALRKALVGRQAYDSFCHDEPYEIIGLTDNLKVQRIYLKDHTMMHSNIDIASILGDTIIPDSERIEPRLVQEAKEHAQTLRKCKAESGYKLFSHQIFPRSA